MYDGVRTHSGLTWFPLLTKTGEIGWENNSRYCSSTLRVSAARGYPELGLQSEPSTYRQYRENQETVQWISEPGRLEERWKKFEP